MKSLLLESIRKLSVVDAPIPRLLPHEALIKVRSVGICGSDISIFSGTHPTITPPAVMGHEVFGIIESLGDEVEDLAVGDPVVCLAGIGCGTCAECMAGSYNLCPDMSVLGGHRPGGLAEFVAVPSTNLMALPRNWNAPHLALIEPAAVAHRATTKLPSENLRGSVAVVSGLGAVGLLLGQILLAKGVKRVFGIDPQSVARQAAENVGIMAASPHSIEKLISEHSVDAVFECSGSARALDQGISLVRNGGTVVLVGIQHDPMEIDWIRVQRYEKTITGVQMYRRTDFESVVALLAQDRIRITDVPLTHVDLGDAPQTFSGLAQGTSQGKFLITIEKEST